MNVLFLHTHDTGQVISPYGYKVPTPNMQRFCDGANTLLFENAFSAAPTCSPSRASLMTGVYPHQNGMLGLAQRGFAIDGSRHLAGILAGHGFRTVLCGVQHEIGYYTDHQLAGALGYAEDITSDPSGYAEKDLVRWDAENARSLVSWLEAYDGRRPFFCSFGQHATHREWPDAEPGAERSVRPPAYIPLNSVTRADFARFCRSASLADEHMGLVLDALERTGHADDTIVLLTTDHGLAYPFAKCTLSDAGCAVMMAMRVPGARLPARGFEGLVSQLDIMPTLHDLLGIAAPGYLEGRSLAGVFRGGEDPGDGCVFGEINFHTSYEPARSVRTGRYKYIRYFDAGWPRQNLSNIDASPVKDWYLARGLEERPKGLECLFDLDYDVEERCNLADDPAYAKILASMQERLLDFMERTDDPLLRGPIPIQPGWKVNRRSCLSAHSEDPDDYESPGVLSGKDKG